MLLILLLGLGGGEGADKSRHEIGKAEDGEEEKDEWFFGQGWRGVGVVRGG